MSKIRSKVVRESLLDYNTLANSLKENTESAVKTLLDEAVRDTYAKLLSEDNDKDYDEEDVEVDDTQDSDAMPDDAGEGGEESTDDVDDADAGMDTDDVDDTDVDGGDSFKGGDANTEVDETEDGEGDGWAEFDKYKVSDDEYDFSNAEDEEIVKVYKLMKNDDQILVHKDEDKVKIQDNETGAEYLIDLGGDEAAGVAATEPGEDEANFELEMGDDDAEDFEGDAEGIDTEGDEDIDSMVDSEGEDDDFNNIDDDMNESTERMFELVLEYDSNVGYTDNYQKKDVMTNPGMSEPGKNVNDWDAGVPKGDAKPWSGYPGKKKKADAPFNAEKGKQVEESVEEINELKTNAEHAANNGSTSRTDGPNNPRRRTGRSFHTAQRGQESGTGDNAYSPGGDANNVTVDVKVENIMRRVNKTLKENKELKGTLTNVMTSLKEAAVTNHNLAQIIKLISENSTTQDEKKEIIGRFAKEAKTIDASKRLYESISQDLKKLHKMNITEGTNLTVESSKKINETPIYKSQDIMESLDLMHRMMK
jgi:hypothetical protein